MCGCVCQAGLHVCVWVCARQGSTYVCVCARQGSTYVCVCQAGLHVCVCVCVPGRAPRMCVCVCQAGLHARPMHSIQRSTPTHLQPAGSLLFAPFQLAVNKVLRCLGIEGGLKEHNNTLRAMKLSMPSCGRSPRAHRDTAAASNRGSVWTQHGAGKVWISGESGPRSCIWPG